MRSARWFSLILVSLFAFPIFARQLPNIDKLGEKGPSPTTNNALNQKKLAFGKKGLPLQGEPRLGVPTFLWGSFAVSTLPSGMRPIGKPTRGQSEAAARVHLGNVAALYNLSPSDVSNAVLRSVHDAEKGPVIVKLKQSVGGIEIFREELNVVMTQKLDLVAVTGYISSKSTPPSRGSLGFQLSDRAAAVKALADATLANIDTTQLIAGTSHDGYDFFTLPAGSAATLLEPVRMKKVYFHTPDGLEPGYFVEIIADASPDTEIARIDDGASDTDGYAYVISAIDGTILYRKNLSADAAPRTPVANLGPGGFTYRVWADPVTGIPYDTPAGNGVHPKVNAVPDGAQEPFLLQNDVTLPNYPFSMNDPWLAPGSTETNGNNVDAFVNLVNAAGNVDNGYGPVMTPIVDPPSGDHRANTSSVDQFLYNHQPDVDAFSAAARQASITQLFYNINFLHDWYYDSGFNEIAGNAQKNNFGRGGLQSDDIKAQAQDTSSFSNANMLTPSDGARPRMRMYNFPNPANMLHLQAPAAIAGKVNIGISQTGRRDFDYSGNIVIATFSNSPSACTITNAAALTGNIAMFDFDNTDSTGCSFSTRITRIHATSALGALMVYTSANPAAVANITGLVASHTKGVGVISWNNGNLIKAQLSLPAAVTARLLRVADRDGSLDQQIVFHEWGHYISNRLIGNALGLNANYCGGMGEGWGDFNAMMLTVRQSDTGTASNANWNGAYATATYATSGVPFDGSANQGYYYGIRRYPYSTDMAINPLTFKHIANGTPLPVTPAPFFGASGANNAEVHNTGEVWATMMWECYAALLRDTLGPTPRLTFQQAQDRMKRYYVLSLMMTPLTPTMLETRDAVLAAAAATDLVDYTEFAQAFAKRGAGIGAVSPDRFSGTNSPVTESFVSGGDVLYINATIDDSTSSCDGDGVLDMNESGVIRVTLRNTGDQQLNATTATITSTNPNVTIANGGLINFAPSAPTGFTTGTVGISLGSAAAGMQVIDLAISYDDPGLALAGPRNATATMRGNTNDIPASTATDTVEANSTVWTTVAGSGTGLFNTAPWVRRQDPSSTNHFWFGADAYFGSDQSLVSPVFTVNGGGSLNLQFDHSYGFEFDAGGNYDGAVIEVSINGGAFADLDTSVYTGTILNYSGNVNPLKGRIGFVQNSAGTVHASLTKAIAPGSTAQVRFRAASDSSIGAAGWTIDNIQINGVVETPFTTVVSDPGCTSTTSTSLSPSANPSPLGVSLTLTATVSSSRGAPPAGTVTFYDGASPLGTNPVTAGVATLSTSSLTQGPHTLTATYNPVPGFSGSTSGPLTETISQATSTTALLSSLSPSAVGNSVTFTATVTASSGATPTGSVEFFDGASSLGSNVLSGGSATLSTSALTGGSHSITATYGGSASIAGSTSTILTQLVQPAAPTITPGGPTTFCAGGSVTLTSSAATGNQWYLNGNPIGGGTNPSYIATASGDYTVTVTVSGVESAQSAATTVTVNPIPSTPAITPGGPTTFCTGGSVTLTSSSASGNQWYLDGNPIGGETNPSYIATASGNYTVVVTTSGCSSAPSAATTVTVTPLPSTPTITPSGPTTFCAGGSVNLTSSSASGNQWYLDGNPIGGATNQTYNATASGNYTVVVTSSGCSSAPSAATTVTVNPIPSTPTITPSGPTTFCAGGSVTLTSSSASGNQWLLNGNPIGGATNQTYVASVAGDYTVTVTTSGCTSAPSAATTVTINPLPNATITAPSSVVSGSTGNIASVANAGVGASYNWTIGNGTITAGTGTNSITFTAGAAGTLTLDVTVTTAASCSDAKSANVTVTAAPPAVTVTSVNPVSGTTLGGTNVTIHGSGFLAGASVTFGGSAATNVVVVSGTQITAKTPAHAAGAVNVTVTNTNTTTGTLNNGYTYNQQNFDANGDHQIDPSDIFYLVNYLFTGGPAPAGSAGPIPSGDANGDGVVDPADVFYLVNYLFGTGPAPSITKGAPVTNAVSAPFSGQISLGQPMQRNDRWFVPVIVTMDPGAEAPRALSLQVRFKGAVADAAMRRSAGAQQPLFEVSRRSGDALSYLLSFDESSPLALDVTRSAVIGEIELATARALRLEIDPSLTMLVGSDGTRKATVAGRTLRVKGSALRSVERPNRQRNSNDQN